MARLAVLPGVVPMKTVPTKALPLNNGSFMPLRMKAALHALAVLAAGVLLGAGSCPGNDSCTSDDECGSRAYCREDGVCQQGSRPGGGSSSGGGTDGGGPDGGAASSSGVASSAGRSSSRAVDSSSAAQGSSVGASSAVSAVSPVSGGSGSGSGASQAQSGAVDAGVPDAGQPDAGPECPDRCGVLLDGGNATAWFCAAGNALADCSPLGCTAPYDRCTPGSQTCETNTATSLDHCGGCDLPVGLTGSACVGGQPVCGNGAACGSGFCLPGADGVPTCLQCRGDMDCQGGTPVCCGGVCTAVGAACGCSTQPGGAAGATCDPAGVGGACVAGGRVLAVGPALAGGATVAQLHAGRCGCGPAGGQPEANVAVCTRGPTGLADFCVSAGGDGGVGTCTPQGVRTDAGPAANCGTPGTTCSVPTGGLECVPEAAGDPDGTCACGGLGAAGCTGSVRDNGGRNHVVARACAGTPARCACGTGAACNANGAQPDCCGTACTNLQTDSNNCGTCGTPAAAPGSDRCVGGQRVCGDTGAACSGSTPFCTANTSGTKVCTQCQTDDQCSGGSPICCRGQCVAPGNACGCSVTPGGTAGATCDAAGAGGACVRADGALVSVGNTLSGARADMHSGTCGCGVPNGQVVSNTAVCAMQNGFKDLCALGTGSRGVCTAQNQPGYSFNGLNLVVAEDCGAFGATCTASRGGLACEPDANGVGACECVEPPMSSAFHPCEKRTLDAQGEYHSVAKECEGSICACYVTPNQQGGRVAHVCDPNGTTPECCLLDGDALRSCVNPYTTEEACGMCGSRCAGANTCTNGTCSCTIQADCANYLGGKACLNNKCVCARNNNQPCPAGIACSTNCGCCAGVCVMVANGVYQCQ